MNNFICAVLYVIVVIVAAVFLGRSLSFEQRLLVFTGSIAALLAGCSFYNRNWKIAEPDPAAPYDFRVVQLDDYGTFWDPDAARATANDIDRLSQSQNLFVVVFVHGWHNNAQQDNNNLVEFKRSLDRIAELLDDPNFVDARQRLTSSPSYRLFGVYVGWRGKSLPMPLDYATMWWRKEAAERVGEGDVGEFLERLQRTYLRANSTVSRPGNPIRKPFMGLVTIGHSFGGQVLLKVLSRPIESDLILRTQRDLADTTHPSLPPQSSRDERVPIDSYGDTNILINPALEAYQFARIDNLYRNLRYGPNQTPQLIVLSADDDWARQAFFPVARVLTLPFRPAFRDAYQGALWSTALGELRTQQTHDLNFTPNAEDSLSVTDYSLDPTKVRNFDFTGHTCFGGVELKPRLDVRVANSPVAVVYTHDDIIQQHSGIFADSLREFLTRYVAFIEGKRMLLRKEKLEAAAACATDPTTCTNSADAD